MAAGKVYTEKLGKHITECIYFIYSLFYVVNYRIQLYTTKLAKYAN